MYSSKEELIQATQLIVPSQWVRSGETGLSQGTMSEAALATVCENIPGRILPEV